MTSMKITFLPERLEKWFLGHTIPYLIQRANHIFSTNNYSQNGRWIINANDEAAAAYEAITRDVWLYSSIYTIASNAAMLPFGVFKRKPTTKGSEYEMDETDQLTILFNQPVIADKLTNFKMTGITLMEAMFWSLELSGRLYLQCFPNKSNPREIYILDPRRMTPKKDSKKYVTGWEYLVDGKPEPLSVEEIVFYRYYNPADEYNGLSGATPAGDAINSNISSNEYNNSFFNNSGIPALALETEKRMTDEEADSLAMRWGKQFKGSKKSHKTAVLYGGLKATILQRSPKDMEFTKQKQLNREETLSAIGVPPVMVGLLESVNYGNSKEQRKSFWQNTLKPKLFGLAQHLSLEFGLDGFKRKFMYDLSGVEALQEDEEIKSRIAFNLSKSGFTWDEIRKRLYNLQPLPDGVGKYPWVPTNLVPANLQINGPVSSPGSNPGKPGKPSGPTTQPGPDDINPDNKPGKINVADMRLTNDDEEIVTRILIG